MLGQIRINVGYIMKAGSRPVSLLMSVLLVFSPFTTSVSLAQSSIDIIPPKVLHEPETETIESGSPYVVTATVTDEGGVDRVTLFYRKTGESDYQSTDLLRSSGGDTFMLELDATDLSEPGLEYYFEAEDVAGNTLLRGFAFDPLVLKVSAPSNFADSAPAEDKGGLSISSNKWLWIGLGAVAVAGLAAAGGGGGGGGGGSDSGTVTVTTTDPTD